MKQILQLHISFANTKVFYSFCGLQMLSYTYFSLSSLTLDHICHCFCCSPFPTSTLQVTSYTKALPGPVLLGSWNFAAPHAMQKKTKTLALWHGTQTPCAQRFPSPTQNQTRSICHIGSSTMQRHKGPCTCTTTQHAGWFPTPCVQGKLLQGQVEARTLSLQGLSHKWVLTYLCYLICQNFTFIIFVPKWF